MISSNQIKFVKSLQQKKFRDQYKLFVAEGRKLHSEALESDVQIHSVFTTDESLLSPDYPCHHINRSELERISGFKTAQDVLTIIHKESLPTLNELSGASIALDRIKDPGNLGTIMRSAEWFGMKEIICSPECVEHTNPKVVQSSMGSIFRLPVRKMDLAELVNNTDQQVLVAEMEGTPPRDVSFEDNCIILIGNESHGVGEIGDNASCTKVSVRSHGKAESLNASIACAVICYEYQRSR